jgi:hypothetical protein
MLKILPVQNTKICPIGWKILNPKVLKNGLKAKKEKKWKKRNVCAIARLAKVATAQAAPARIANAKTALATKFYLLAI